MVKKSSWAETTTLQLHNRICERLLTENECDKLRINLIGGMEEVHPAVNYERLMMMNLVYQIRTLPSISSKKYNCMLPSVTICERLLRSLGKAYVWQWTTTSCIRFESCNKFLQLNLSMSLHSGNRRTTRNWLALASNTKDINGHRPRDSLCISETSIIPRCSDQFIHEQWILPIQSYVISVLYSDFTIEVLVRN